MDDYIQTRAAKVRSLADQIENNPNDRKAVAEALRVIAEVMEPCEDCGHPIELVEPKQDATDAAAAGV